MKVLIGCECSGVVREAFRRKGHDAWSCDLKPTEQPGQHIQGDLREVLQDPSWDFIGLHPECTFLTNSGVRWLYTDGMRWKSMFHAAEFFRMCLADPRPGYVENPIPHKYAAQLMVRKYDQVIQPWQFGHGEIKATCLWLKSVPKLKPTNIVDGRVARVHRMAPGPERATERSRTLPGIAEAMASQWAL